MTALRFTSAPPLVSLTLILSLFGCGGSAITSESDGSGGTSGGANTGGGVSSGGGTSTGGVVSSGGASAGGGVGVGGVLAVGGSPASGGQPGTGGAAECNVHDDCVIAVDAAEACGCNRPIAVSRAELASEPCLYPWRGIRPMGCGPEPQPCPEVDCAPEPLCASARCEAGACVLHTDWDPETCGDCATLDATRRAALEAATACNPAMSSLSCDASAIVQDECGCPRVVNERNPELVEAAKVAYDAWSSACGHTVLCPAALCLVPQAGGCGIDGVCRAQR